MPETDLHQPGLGPLFAPAEAAELAQAAFGLASGYGYRLDSDSLATLARSITEAGPPVHRCVPHDRGCRPGGVRLVTDHRQKAEAER